VLIAYRGVQGVVHKLVGQLVVLAPHGPVLHLADFARDPARFLEQRLQSRVLDPVVAGHLPHHQLRV